MRTTTLSCIIITLAMALGMAGCVGYSSYPGLPNDTALNDTNTTAMRQVTLESLRYVSQYRELPKQYTLNLPYGMVAENLHGIQRQLDDPRASLLSRDNTTLPGVHIVEIRIRGTKAQVDLATPLPGVNIGTDGIAYETNTLYLQGGVRRWRVTDARRWSIASANVPDPYFIEDAPTIERGNTAAVNATNETN
ncbi:MAG: hypothetical protein ACYTF7_05900 [Planctomycetota bacterium]